MIDLIYRPEGIYSGMSQAEALGRLASRYLRKPECVALCNGVAADLSKLVAELEQARAEIYRFKLAIMGSEDVSGHAHSLTVEEAEEMLREERQQHLTVSGTLEARQYRLRKLEEASLEVDCAGVEGRAPEPDALRADEMWRLREAAKRALDFAVIIERNGRDEGDNYAASEITALLRAALTTQESGQ